MTISDSQKLTLYCGALRECKSRKLASLTENREPRYLLDDVWADGAVKHCIEDGLWTFAIRSVGIVNDPDYTADFGYQYRFSQPADFVRTASVCVDEFYEEPLTSYTEEGGFWFADLSTIFVKYVSNDTAWGMDYTKWTPSFVLFVELYLASRIVGKLTGAVENEEVVAKKLKMAASDARSKSAMEQPTRFPPLGMLNRARAGQWGRRGWRG